MGSALDQLINGNTSDQPVDFKSYYNAYGRDHAAWPDSYVDIDPNGLLGRTVDKLFGTVSSAKQDYENYLSAFEFKKNQKARAEENAWTAQREDSQVQRAMKDIEAAGLNPWLALNGGSMSSAMTASQSASARYKARESYLKQANAKNNNKAASLLGSALKIIMIAALAS